MGKGKDQQQQARQEARQLLQNVGENLSRQEAQRVAERANISVAQVAQIAQRQDINVRPAVQAAAAQLPQPPQPRETPASPSSQPTGSVKSVIGGGLVNAKDVNTLAAAGFSPERIAQVVKQQGGAGNYATALTNLRGASQQPTQQPGPTNELSRYGNNGGFGLNSYQAAINDGYDPADIATLLPGSGLVLGEKANSAIRDSLYGYRQGAYSADQYRADADYYKNEADVFRNDLEFYKGELESVGARYEDRFSQLSNQYEQALSARSAAEGQLFSARNEATEAKQRADDLERQRKEEQEAQVAQQLTSLRSGSTTSGTPGTGLGSLTSGRSSYSISTGGRSGGVLDRAYKDIDPTDSVLNKDVAASFVGSVSSNRGSARAEARQRALAGGSASRYYSRRFG